MKRLFWRYFISIFALALLILLIQTGVLLFQYGASRERWKTSVYDDFVDAVTESLENGEFIDYGMNSIMMTISNLGDDRVSGFVLRDANSDRMFTYGKTPNGMTLTSLMSMTGEGDSKGNRLFTTKARLATRIDVTVREDGSFSAETSKVGGMEIRLPSSFQHLRAVGSVLIAIDGEDEMYIDLLSHTPMTYVYSKDIIRSCLRGVLVSIPVCLLIALVAAWFISSRNTAYINSVRKALNDLAKGKNGVSVPHQRNSELEEISVAIKDLDGALQSNAKSRKAWLYSISHDLNTPTTAMKMMIDGLNDGVFPAEEETFKALQKENDTLSEIIDRVITFSSLQADAEAVIDNVSCRQFADRVLEGLEERDCIEVETECETIRCDLAKMSRAVTELLKNAVAGRGDCLEPVRWIISEDGESYRMDFLNRGHINISVDNDIFEPWVRGDWARSEGGSGLGLPIASTIMALHKGFITLKQDSEDMVRATISWPRQTS